MKTEKKFAMYGIGLVLLTLIGVSVAYFITEITGDSKSVSVTTGDLRVVFTDTDGSITGTDIEPSWSESKAFSVENKTNSEYKYDIVIEDLVNTFKTTGYLVYKITSSDGGYNMTEYKDVPKSSTATDTVLAYSVSIPSKTIHTYTIEIKYINDEENSQNIDMNSTLSGNIYITKGSNPDLKTAMLRDNPTISERTDFSVTNTSNTTGTIYKTNKTEDGSDVYYYSGNTTNNWVKFGKYANNYTKYRGQYSSTLSSYKEYDTLEACNSASSYNYNCTAYTYWNTNDDMYWRIIRTNEDGSVRLLYAGTSPEATETFMGSSKFTNSYDESRYIGYMYGGNTSLTDARGNTTSSTMKEYLDSWYETHLLTNYGKYISKSAIYCNDRSIYSGTWSGTTSGCFEFSSKKRIENWKRPNYKCGSNEEGNFVETTQAVADKFSVDTSAGGNGDLTYGIALMTVDELAFAGGVVYTGLTSPYAWFSTNSEGEKINVSGTWLTLSPMEKNGTTLSYYMVVDSSRWSYTDAGRGAQYNVRGVISIDPCAKVTGTGTPTDPYVIDTASSTCS